MQNMQLYLRNKQDRITKKHSAVVGCCEKFEIMYGSTLVAAQRTNAGRFKNVSD